MSSKADELYKLCAERAQKGSPLFNQKDLENLQVCSDPKELLDVVNHLLRSQLFRLLQLQTQNLYQIRPKDIANRLRSLTNDELQIFNRIEDEGKAGIWTKAIKQRTQIAQTVLNKSLKSLETKHLVKTFINSKFPQRKYYILYSLEPLEEVTGGAFHDPDNGELDTVLIEVLSQNILTYVQSKSWNKQTVTIPTPAVERPSDPAELARMQQAIYAAGSGAPGEKYRPPPPHRKKKVFTPKPPTYEEYPNTADIADFIKHSGLLKESVQLSVSDIQLLVDSLLFDNKLERMPHGTYRVVRTALVSHNKRVYADGWYGTGFTEVPCSRCPVFNLCEEGSQISASNCEYYARWLRPQNYGDMEDIGRELVLKRPKVKEDIL